MKLLQSRGVHYYSAQLNRFSYGSVAPEFETRITFLFATRTTFANFMISMGKKSQLCVPSERESEDGVSIPFKYTIFHLTQHDLQYSRHIFCIVSRVLNITGFRGIQPSWAKKHSIPTKGKLRCSFLGFFIGETPWSFRHRKTS